jgi:RNA polymerase sigma-70 factor, ECF subfamily
MDMPAAQDHALAHDVPKDVPAGRPPSFAEVFEQHVTFVWRVSARRGVARADPPDISQEVFIAVYRMLPGFEGRSSLRTWLYAICLRTISRHRRKALRHPEELTSELPEPSIPSHQIEAFEAREFRNRLERVLFRLPCEQRELFVLYELEELSVPEAAAVVGCPVQTAYSRLHAAREAVVAAFHAGKGYER